MRYYFQLSAEGKSQYTSQHIQTSVQKLTVYINHCQKAIAEKTFALFKCRVWSAVTCIQYKQNYRHLQVHSIKVCKGHSSHYISTEASFCLTFCPTLWCQKELSWAELRGKHSPCCIFDMSRNNARDFLRTCRGWSSPKLLFHHRVRAWRVSEW